MIRSVRSTMLRSGAALATLLLGAGIAAAPAQAHETPRAGSTCAVSGMTEIDHGKAYVCVSRTEGATPRWGRGLTISRAQLTLANGWAKAAPKGMTAGFGMLANPTAKPITVIGGFTSAAKAVQLHEVVDKDGAMVMQQKAGGLVIPAGGMLELKPGGNHLMLIGLTRAITAGDLVPVTLITSDGGLLKVKLLAKVYNGANETYMSGM
jgi:periplasmic copper chaperone A